MIIRIRTNDDKPNIAIYCIRNSDEQLENISLILMTVTMHVSQSHRVTLFTFYLYDLRAVLSEYYPINFADVIKNRAQYCYHKLYTLSDYF